MKIPKTFLNEKCSEKALEKMLNFKEDCLFNKKINRLLSSCDEFLEQLCGSQEYKHHIGEKIASKLVYTLDDVENLSKRISLDPPLNEHYAENLGYYFSALINKIITENDTVNLTPCMKLSGIGLYLAKGNVIVDGNAGSWAGAYMAGGNLVVLGNAGDYIGYEMVNGIIAVAGKVGGTVGYQSKGGEIYADEIESMIAQSCNAVVYKKGEKIWPNDSSNSRGWLF